MIKEMDNWPHRRPATNTSYRSSGGDENEWTSDDLNCHTYPLQFRSSSQFSDLKSHHAHCNRFQSLASGKEAVKIRGGLESPNV